MTTKTSNTSNWRSGPLGLAAKTSTLIGARICAILTLLLLAAGLSASAQNILPNPGFEDGIGSWTGSIRGSTASVVTDAVTAHSGTNYASTTGGQPSVAEGSFPADVKITVPISGLKFYKLSAWVQIPVGDNPGTISLRYRWEPSGNRVNVGEKPIAADGTWVQLQSGWLQPAPADTTLGYFEVYRTAGATATLYVDDCALDEADPLTLNGRVVDGSSVGVDGVSVLASSSDFTTAAVLTAGGGNYTLSVPPGTYTVRAAKVSSGLKGSTTVAVSSSPTTASDIVLAVDPNWDPNIIWNVNVDDLPADGSAIASWPARNPIGSVFPKVGSPTVVASGGVKWEQNLYATGDGFVIGSSAVPIPLNGGFSVVSIIQPVQNGISDAWNALVNIFHTKMVIGVRNNSGQVQVFRQGVGMTTPNAIPDGQKTVLSWVVQSSGAYKIYANGVLFYEDTTTTSDMTQIVPGAATHEQQMTFGRGYTGDGWPMENANIGDTAVYNKALTDAERIALEASLAAKFGLATTVTGTVKDSVTLAGVAGAQVELLDGSSLVVAGPVTSGVGGSYTLTGIELPAGSYTVVATKPNYTGGSTPVTTTGSGTYPGNDVTITKLVTTDVSGTVKMTGSGTPVAGVVVTATDTGNPAHKYSAPATTSSGTYTLTIDQGTTWQLSAQVPFGYTVVSVPAAFSPTGATLPGQDITLDVLLPLVDVNAASLTPGSAVSTWANAGSLGGNFIPAPSNGNGFGLPAPTAAVGGGKKAVWFANNPMVLVDGSGNAISSPTTLLGTFNPADNSSVTKPVFTIVTWLYKQQLLTDQQSAYCSFSPFAYGANFFYGAGWADDHFVANNSLGFNGEPAAGSWHQIVHSCDGTTESVYVDGLLNNSVTPSADCIAPRDPGWWGAAGDPVGTYLGAGSPILLGSVAWAWKPGQNYTGDPGFGSERSYTGFMGGLRIYNVAATAADVTSLHSSFTLAVGTTHTISGHVYQPDGTTGIDGATVVVTVGGALVTAPVTTSGGGAYTVTVGPGTYDLAANASGYLGGSITGVAVTTADVAGRNFTLGAIPADRLAIYITGSEATGAGVVNHGYYGGSFVSAQGTPTVGLAGPSGDQRSAITFGNFSRWQLQKTGLDVAAGGEVCGNQPWTVVAWVYQDSTLVNQNDGPRNMYFTWSPLGAPGAAGCGLGWRTWGGAFPGFDSANTPVVCWDGYSDDFATTLATGLMPWDAWNQMVTKYDGTALHFYKNGVEVIGGTASSVMPRTYNLQTTAGNPFDLGGFSNGWGDAFYQGSIARLKMYSKALTQAEIDADFANPPGVAAPIVTIGSITPGVGAFTITGTSDQSVNVRVVKSTNVAASLGLWTEPAGVGYPAMPVTGTFTITVPQVGGEKQAFYRLETY
jgi:hypothetical protein